MLWNMRTSLPLLLSLALTSPAALDAQTISMATAVDVPHLYGTDGPRAVPAEHALHRRITIEPIAGMPKPIGKFLVPIAKPEQINEALRTSFDRAQMLAGPAGAGAKLFVTLRSFDVPWKIGASHDATLTMGYELRRIDNGQVVFQRDITTHSRGSGGDAAERMKLNARLAVQKNIASAIACLDKAAYGAAPADCTIGQNVGLRGEWRRR
jgi:hypothetical protein